MHPGTHFWYPALTLGLESFFCAHFESMPRRAASYQTILPMVAPAPAAIPSAIAVGTPAEAAPAPRM